MKKSKIYLEATASFVATAFVSILAVKVMFHVFIDIDGIGDWMLWIFMLGFNLFLIVIVANLFYVHYNEELTSLRRRDNDTTTNL
tara:strand:- start:7470 stop:7724 length:255 start_codon:yes stop_codon:yes gene_type:complete